MNIGQTSIIVFFSKFMSSIVGFFATLYFARKLGPEVIGLYALVMTIVGWSILTTELGIGSALVKRVSENEQRGAYFIAAIVWIGILMGVLSVVIIGLQQVLEQYVGEFSNYTSISVIWFIIPIIFIKSTYTFFSRVLKGERKVEIVGAMDMLKIVLENVFKVALVIIGYGLVGMLIGYMIGALLIAIISAYWVSTRPTMPKREHFKSLFDYAKFSWLGSLKSRAFNDVDILILGVFVPSALVGVYSIAWSLAKFLELFGNSISSTMFPEISFASTENTKDAVSGLVENSLAFTGLIAIPGLIGGTILAPRLLQLYGPEFTQGATVLALLILATLLYSYLKQLMNGLNGIDRPDLAFRVNAVFIALNAGLNAILIWQFGIEGAAIASVVSVIVALIIAYRFVNQLVSFDAPLREVGRQCIAALAMGGVVWGGLYGIENTAVIRHNAIIVLLLVGIGALFYFTMLLGISSRFRATVDRNLPVDLPLI